MLPVGKSFPLHRVLKGHISYQGQRLQDFFALGEQLFFITLAAPQDNAQMLLFDRQVLRGQSRHNASDLKDRILRPVGLVFGNRTQKRRC